jgi:hypothetical protein
MYKRIAERELIGSKSESMLIFKANAMECQSLPADKIVDS